MTNTWVLLRGLTRESGHWGHFTQRFQDALDADVLMIDFPGVGSRWQQDSPTSIQAIADFTFSEIQTKRPNQRCNILAHSMGAMVSASMLQKTPELFDRVVWMSTSFANLSPWYHRLQIKNVSQLARGVVQYKDYRRREEMIFDLTVNLNKDPNIVASWVDIQTRHPVSQKTFFRQLWAASRFWYTSHTHRKTLLLSSLKDRFVHVKCSQDISDAFDLPLAIHPEAGHDLPVDAPAWIISEITSWL